MTGHRILYIDDEPGLRRLVQRDLQRHGYTVETAPDGEAGLAQAQTGGFDCVCLDHYMPGQDGLETLAGLRALPEPPPVIFVTGADDGRLAVAALRAGAADYVIKEAGEDFLVLLRSAIEAAIERAALRAAHQRAEAAVREARDRAESLARQRAVLLREVNHRVANSLQLIGSLARLQEGAVADPAARGALAAMRNRIAAVAQVHRRLYTSEDVQSVALHDYMAGLIEELARAADNHAISLEAEPLVVSTDRAVSLGVILSELVTNAMKYAYPEAGQGPIRVQLRCTPEGGEMAVQDDGVGTEAGAPGGTGLGRRIVEALSAGIGGTVEHVTGPGGTRVSVRFALD
ncbi:response regulator [Siccirubricoccus sp. KC 17139]|uniref:histidine kinase n=1 Tax=Siccirubricoccus soli TaxID=2899147 RepID=A0ABT1D473_9PROT|nr:response regulator [Siccirubricoccus soli]MCO6416720.1 response regulator [Siccirubricoccus soli]MCP2682855.1 response regulator [Siccirubricoccus soli]